MVSQYLSTRMKLRQLCFPSAHLDHLRPQTFVQRQIDLFELDIERVQRLLQPIRVRLDLQTADRCRIQPCRCCCCWRRCICHCGCHPYHLLTHSLTHSLTSNVCHSDIAPKQRLWPGQDASLPKARDFPRDLEGGVRDREAVCMRL